MKTLKQLISQLPTELYIELSMALQHRQEFIWERLAGDDRVSDSHFKQCEKNLTLLTKSFGLGKE